MDRVSSKGIAARAAAMETGRRWNATLNGGYCQVDATAASYLDGDEFNTYPDKPPLNVAIGRIGPHAQIVLEGQGQVVAISNDEPIDTKEDFNHVDEAPFETAFKSYGSSKVTTKGDRSLLKRVELGKDKKSPVSTYQQGEG